VHVKTQPADCSFAVTKVHIDVGTCEQLCILCAAYYAYDKVY